jgi:hypothetical protein
VFFMFTDVCMKSFRCFCLKDLFYYVKYFMVLIGLYAGSVFKICLAYLEFCLLVLIA